MSSVPLYNKEGRLVKEIDLDGRVFDGEVNKILLHQVMVMYSQNKRSGSASTKTRKDVRGGGRKPWRQKGTGRARAGSIRSPIWRGGGVVFGPHPRDYSYSLPKRMKRQALTSALNSKVETKELVVIEAIALEEPKTKKLVSILSKLKALEKPLIVLNDLDPKVLQASRNLPGASIRTAQDFNAYDVMRHRKLIIEKVALEGLVSRIWK